MSAARKQPLGKDPKRISYDQGIDVLLAAIARSGGATAYAKRLAVSPAWVSMMANGKRNITGAVAQDLGLKLVYSYELTTVVPCTKQEQYEKQRAERQNEIQLQLDHWQESSTGKKPTE